MFGKQKDGSNENNKDLPQLILKKVPKTSMICRAAGKEVTVYLRYIKVPSAYRERFSYRG